MKLKDVKTIEQYNGCFNNDLLINQRSISDLDLDTTESLLIDIIRNLKENNPDYAKMMFSDIVKDLLLGISECQEEHFNVCETCGDANYYSKYTLNQ